LFIMALRDNGRLVALAPLCLLDARALGLRIRVVEPLVTGHADYRNLLICRSQNRRRIVRAIIGWLYDRAADWDVIDLADLTSRDATTLHLATVATKFPDLKCVARVTSRTPRLRYSEFPVKRSNERVKRVETRSKKLRAAGYTLHAGIDCTDRLW